MPPRRQPQVAVRREEQGEEERRREERENEEMEGIRNAIAELREELERERGSGWEDNFALKIDSFYGNASDNARLWLDQFERTARANGWGEEKEYRVMCAAMRGPAAIWFNNLTEEEKNAANLKRSFLANYANPSQTMLLRQMARERKQKSFESVSTFSYDISILFSQIENMNEEEKIDVFINNLIPGIREHVRRAFPNTLKAAITIAETNEAILKADGTNSLLVGQVSFSSNDRLEKIERQLQQLLETSTTPTTPTTSTTTTSTDSPVGPLPGTTDLYEIDTILDKRKKGKGFQYFIKWRGYPIEDSTWEPASNIPVHFKEAFEARSIPPQASF